MSDNGRNICRANYTLVTFLCILEHIRPKLEKETVTEEPISPEFRLAVCLYRLDRGDYIYTIAKLTGLGHSTVCTIVTEVCNAIVKGLWHSMVGKHFPSCKDEFETAMTDMEQSWQICYAFAAIDGCHLPIKCPPGGRESNKECHHFK